ncbi:MAG: hypothetical protein HQK74_08160 [Desulfamplus sp.]|nr:hypothetical protein [Desulfamplus sp.]
MSDDNFIDNDEHLYIGGDFWKSPSLEALANAQNVKPIVDVKSLFGTWPGEPDDQFEELVDKLRHSYMRIVEQKEFVNDCA